MDSTQIEKVSLFYIVVLDPLHLDVAVHLPLLLLLQPLLQLPVVGLVQVSAGARLKPAVRGRVRHERGLRDALVVAGARDLRAVLHDGGDRAVLVDDGVRPDLRAAAGGRLSQGGSPEQRAPSPGKHGAGRSRSGAGAQRPAGSPGSRSPEPSEQRAPSPGCLLRSSFFGRSSLQRALGYVPPGERGPQRGEP